MTLSGDSVNINCFAKYMKFRYFAKVMTYSKSPDHVLQSYI